MPCQRDTPRCLSATNYAEMTDPCCMRNLRNVVHYVLDLLEANHIPYWADYGTLLGAVRHGGIIPWDGDADLSIRAEDLPKLMALQRKVELDGYEWDYMDERERVQVRYSRVNRTNVDIFAWRTREDGTLYRKGYCPVIDPYKGKDFPLAWLYPLQHLPFEGRTVPAPFEAERLLAHRYGADWRTPLQAANDGVLR